MCLKRMAGALLTAALMCLGNAADAALLADRRPPPAGLLPGRAARPMSPSDAARIAQQQNGGGRVLSVENGDRGYRVKLLKDGDVRIVYVPGE